MGTHATGRWQELSFESEALRGNALGDPHVRPLFVWTPPSYDDDASRRYPSVYVIQGMTGIARAWFNTKPWQTPYPAAVEALGVEAVVVLVDAWTAVGGSQFLDSPATGRYHTYLCDEVVPFVDGRFRTLAAAAHRGIQGKSSGGYGAMVTPMLRPDLFGALATHAGDALFDVCYRRDFAPAARALREEYGGSWDAFWAEFRGGSREPFTKSTDEVLVNTYAMAAAYSPRDDGTVELPFDENGAVREDVYARWLAWDPVRMAPRHEESLRALRGVWIDAGRGDEYFLDLGASAFRDALREAGVADDVVRFELFPGRHGDISWRYPLSLAWLVERLSD